MASGLLNVNVVGGSSPNWQLTVTSVGACAAGDHVVATLSGLPVGRGAPFRVTGVPDLVTINITDDLKPGGGTYGQPASGPASFYTPTANYRLQQLADKAPYWAETSRRDSSTIDLALKAIQDQISGSTGAPVQAISDLRAVGPTQRQDKQTRLVEDKEAIYAFDSAGVGADDGDGTIVPSDITPPDPGRWFKVNAATQNHENLIGLLGGAPNDHQHLTTAEKALIGSGSVKEYATEAALLADSPANGILAYAQDTSRFWWRRDSTWEESPQESLEVATQEALTFPVDYNDVTAVDPPTGKVFSRQAEITAFLAASGTSNFKTFQAAWYSAPSILRHDVTFNLAAGAHRPRNPEANTRAFTLDQKFVTPTSNIYINGALGSQYRVDVASATITSVSGGSDPYVDFSGTPFAGLDLRGLFVVFNTGQVSVIHKNTSSRLYVMNVVSPAPASAFVGRPSTILRNSYNDTSRVKSYAVFTMLGLAHSYTSIRFNDISIEGFGASFDYSAYQGFGRLTRVLFDHAGVKNQFGVSGSGRPIQTWDAVVAMLGLYTSSIRGTQLATVPDANTDGLYFVGRAALFQNTYVGGGNFAGVYCSGNLVYISVNRTVIDQCTIGIYADVDSLVANQDDYYTGRTTTIRNCGIGILLDGGGRLSDYSGERWIFEGTTGPCIRVGRDSEIKVATDPVMNVVNGSTPNSDVGIDIVGPNSRAELAPGVAASGALGDVRFNGMIMSYAEIVTDGPYINLDGSRVSHG